MPPSRDRIAIALMTFDRPDYLERVLQSIVDQNSFRALQADFFVFQDGSLDSGLGTPVADVEKLKASREATEKYLPNARRFGSVWNLGVALNFDRAERLLYNELGYEVVLFLEDDLVLHKNYFRAIEALLDVTEDRADIGMVSARGYTPTTPAAVQSRHASRVELMDEHNWGFAMRKTAWEMRDAVLGPYLDLMRRTPYRKRDFGANKIAIHAFQRSLFRHGAGYLTSQDSMKNLAMELLGLHRITTYVNLGLYIGKDGLHSNANKFDAKGYGQTIIYDDDLVDFLVPDSHTLKFKRLDLQYR